jgi:hypothetical protein
MATKASESIFAASKAGAAKSVAEGVATFATEVAGFLETALVGAKANGATDAELAPIGVVLGELKDEAARQSTAVILEHKKDEASKVEAPATMAPASASRR